MAGKKGFVFYDSFLQAIESLPKEYQGEMYSIIAAYGLRGQEPGDNTNPFLISVFKALKPQLHYNTEEMNG